MTKYDIGSIADYLEGRISWEIAEKQLFTNTPWDNKYVDNFLAEINSHSYVEINESPGFRIDYLWIEKNPLYLDVLNKFLLSINHNKHQEIAWELQSIKSPSTVPYVRKVFESNFYYMNNHNCSGSAVVAKWFSHLLWNIGSPEAIALINECTQSTDEGIRSEMLYRLERIKEESEEVDNGPKP